MMGFLWLERRKAFQKSVGRSRFQGLRSKGWHLRIFFSTHHQF